MADGKLGQCAVPCGTYITRSAWAYAPWGEELTGWVVTPSEPCSPFDTSQTAPTDAEIATSAANGCGSTATFFAFLRDCDSTTRYFKVVRYHECIYATSVDDGGGIWHYETETRWKRHTLEWDKNDGRRVYEKHETSGGGTTYEYTLNADGSTSSSGSSSTMGDLCEDPDVDEFKPSDLSATSYNTRDYTVTATTMSLESNFDHEYYNNAEYLTVTMGNLHTMTLSESQTLTASEAVAQAHLDWIDWDDPSKLYWTYNGSTHSQKTLDEIIGCSTTGRFLVRYFRVSGVGMRREIDDVASPYLPAQNTTSHALVTRLAYKLMDYNASIETSSSGYYFFVWLRKGWFANNPSHGSASAWCMTSQEQGAGSCNSRGSGTVAGTTTYYPAWKASGGYWEVGPSDLYTTWGQAHVYNEVIATPPASCTPP